MTLARKMALMTVSLAVSLVVIVAASLWGLFGLSRHLDEALHQYDTLRDVYQAGVHIALVRSYITSDRSTDPQMQFELRSAISQLDLVVAEEIPGRPRQHRLTDEASTAAWETLAKLRYLQATSNDPTMSPATEAEVINAAMNQLGKLAGATRGAIQDAQTQAEARRRTAVTLVAGVSALVVLGTMLLSYWQYRSVVRPLNRMRRGVSQIAAGQFGDRLDEHGDREFVELAADFNRMAAELETLYRDLEQKVADTSKELVRSERLASVGFLAAGVAHEINNPLGIMSGHAELALRRISKAHDDALPEAERALRIVCDEAYRCKGIIEKLLSMARSSGDAREPVSVAQVARDVKELVAGLKRYSDRSIDLDLRGSDDELTIIGNAPEVKQALLNLTINALEATPAQVGRVNIAAQRNDGQVSLSVSDNGRGMTQQVLDRVFEPFFSHRPQSDGAASDGGGAQAPGTPGTGLGLSITHAIIQAHGGRIRAESDGPGKGARFTIHWPAAAAK